MIKDSHAHLYLEDFADDIEQVIADANEVGVGEIYMPNIDISSIERMHDIERRFPNCKSMMGLHPCYVKEDYLAQLTIMEEHMDRRSYAAVGEIGIDLYWDKTFVNEQFEAFRRQIDMAARHDLGFVIHSRDALDDTISIVKEKQKGHLKGIFHCFNGTVEQGLKIIDLGFYLGIGGVVTYKNAGVGEVIARLPLSSMVIETDSPYLSPGPKRVKRNVPSRIPLILDKMEEVLGVSQDDIVAITTANCESVFAY